MNTISFLRVDLRRRSPSEVALMVASEFSRASTLYDSRDGVIDCYTRARNILGVLEILPLSTESATILLPLYRRCVVQKLLSESGLQPDVVRETATALAADFRLAAAQLPQEMFHA